MAARAARSLTTDAPTTDAPTTVTLTADALTAGAGTAGTGTGPVGVRLAGLTADALDSSRIPLSTELALRIVALDETMRADAAGISDALHALIATEGARPFKSRLVGLRRAVHRGALVGALLDAAAPPEVIGPELTGRIRRHAARRDARGELLAQLTAELATETRSAAAALGRLAQDPAFAVGLGYASPDLYDDVLRWLDRERLAPGRRPLDRAAVRLAKYAARAVAKPSPLTTFAASGFGGWAEAAGAAVRLESTDRATVVEAGLLPLARIAAALAHLPELGATVRLRVNPFATLVPSPDGDRWLFTTPGPSGEVRSLPATAALTAILAAAREARTPAGLRALLGGPDASTDGVVRADAVVAQLVRLGLLEVHPDLPDQGLTASTLSAWLDQQVPGQVRSERLAGLLDDLRAIRDQIDAARSAAPTEHRGIAAILHARTADAARRLGLLAPAEEPERGTGYFHHTVVTGTAATLDREAWRPALADLALVPGLLAPFDTLGPRRAALQQRAVTLHGPGFRRPLTAFLQGFGSWWAEATTATPTERDARRQAALRGLIADTPEDAGGTVRLSPQAVRALCGDWPDPHTAGDRHACYVQALPGTPAGLGLVLNTVTCGHGTGRTRIARLLGSTLGGTSDTAGSIGTIDTTSDATFDVPQDADAPLYAEFDAAFGSALNQRVPATPDAIDLDGSHPDRSAGHLLRPADLEVVHDRQAQRLHLVHRDTGRVVRPLHLGLLATPLLPLPARLLVEAFGQTSYAFWSDWPQLWQSDQKAPVPEPTADAAPTPGLVRRVARLALGSVVLRRACWFADRGQAPARAAGEPDAGYLVRVHAWREAHGVPLRCFLRTLTPRPAEGFAGPALHDKDRKPVYVDFTHPHLLRVFEHAAATGRPLLLTEALPELRDAPAHRDGRRHAAEFLIELPPATALLPDPTTERRPATC
ncbi:hypothetical protein [Kitasatospora sp. NBC_01302]|uniref:hypothetical protein n=1 Tax=Kitasatospora sp. NBC_01302 TaxID=2903575 RepID=UPI002E132886|nr:lantibiotic dehydratase family protein [Kitasatospora sp. NBC_01302]